MTNSISKNLMPETSGIDFDSIIKKQRPVFSSDFSVLANEGQFETNMRALNDVLSVDGQWFMFSGQLPSKDFFNRSKSVKDQVA